MTPQETQQIFLQHIIASLQNDITYLESLDRDESTAAVYFLERAIFQLKILANE